MEPGAIRGRFVEWWPVRKLTATKTHKPSQNFVEGIFDALTSSKPFLLTPALSPHTLHKAFIIAKIKVSFQTP